MYLWGDTEKINTVQAYIKSGGVKISSQAPLQIAFCLQILTVITRFHFDKWAVIFFPFF